MHRILFMAALAVSIAQTVGAVEYHMDAQTRSLVLPDSYRYDLRPGLSISCRVKFDEPIEEKGEMTILRKGNPNVPGAILLRVDGPKEGVKFSFFGNARAPRLDPRPGEDGRMVRSLRRMGWHQQPHHRQRQDGDEAPPRRRGAFRMRRRSHAGDDVWNGEGPSG